MKKILFLFILIQFSCSHKVVRTGYTKVRNPSQEKCIIYFTKEHKLQLDSMNLKGSIQLKESGFSVSCNAEHAYHIMEKEACAIGANLVLITEEKMPDFWSSCYRCTANMYRLDSNNIATLFTQNDWIIAEDVKTKKKEGSKKNTSIILGSVIGGVVAGITVGILSKK